MKSSLTVLHIEDSREDSELIRQILVRDGIGCDITRVETRSDTFTELEKGAYDLILADCKLPSFSGLHALEIAHALKPEVPFVFVSGTIGEETAIESLRNGATDYVLKDSLTRLPAAVRRAMAEAEERKLNRKLQQRLREAARLEAVSTLSNGIAHDFNNILTIILGHSSLLTMEYDRPERVLEITETIAQAARRASEVVQQLLAFARKTEGHAVPTDLNRRVQEMMSLLKGNLTQQIDLSFEPGLELPLVRIDTGQFERMLMNVVSNAIDSISDGGKIILSTHLVPATEVPELAPELASEYYVRLSVTDNGKGIDPETREHIFEPFYTTKERGRGTGLGLPVVYGLMQAHNGWIDIQSELGKGTTVSLFFPVQPQAPKRKAVSHVSDPALSGIETILIVEDEADVGFYLETVFQSHGYTTLLAHDYEQALALLKTHSDAVQLVFSDLGLPKVDGITVCRELRELKPGLKVILSSGYAFKDFKARMEDAGIRTFVPKPYNTQDILRTTRTVLDGSAARSGV